ncbi:ABC transporter permease [Bacillus velezensis]|uniref:ABC transporter permease n=1 Tax=Bacillus velezensis TaxID=492670 RepID=UPI0039AEF161
MYQFLILFQPLLFLITLYYMSDFRAIDFKIDYIIISGIISTWSYVLYSSGSALIVEKWDNTFSLLIGTNTSLFRLLFIKTICNSIVGTISLLLTILYSKLFFKVDLSSINLLFFLYGFLALIYSLMAIGIILALVFALFKNAIPYQNLIIFPTLLLSGLIIPIQNIPFPFSLISLSSPLFWIVSSMRENLNGTNNNYLNLLISLGLSSFYLFITFFITKKLELSFRKHNKLGVTE